VYESLRAAELAIGDEKRRPAVARAVERVVRSDHKNSYMADIAVRTLDLDRLAAELAARVDYHAWADRLAPAITAPTPPSPDSRAVQPRTSDETAPDQPHHPPATLDNDAPEDETRPGPLDHDDENRDRDDLDDEDEDPDDEEFNADDTVDLAPDLVPLLPAARAARDELLAEGRTVSRDALAHRLRHNGTAIRNNRVSELLNTLRREENVLNSGRPKVPA
jgi:hypothetical protein